MWDDGEQFWVDFLFFLGDKDLHFPSTIGGSWTNLDDFLSLESHGYRSVNSHVIDEFEVFTYVPGTVTFAILYSFL